MTQTEQTLDRIFAICDHVAETGEAIRSEDEGREIEQSWLGLPTRRAAMALELLALHAKTNADRRSNHD